MDQKPLYWSKNYGIDTSDEILDFYILYYKEGHYRAIIEFQEGRGNNPDPMQPAYTLIREEYIGFSENEVYDQCKKWIDTKFQSKYNVIEKDSSKHQLL